jgi:repressor LexA
MHHIQETLLKLIDQRNIGSLTLRQIGEIIHEKLPQKVKHHLYQLEQKGFISIDTKNEKISRVKNKANPKNLFVSIPIVGSANCGNATIYADQNIEGYLKISKRLISKQKGVFAIKAQGNSLNKANINGKNIESGDFVIIDSNQIIARDGDYVLSIIDNMANIKKYRLDHNNERIVLVSESTQNFNPIFIHKNDDFRINGKVIDIIKRFED